MYVIPTILYLLFTATRMGVLGIKRMVVPPQCLANRFGKIWNKREHVHLTDRIVFDVDYNR